MSHDDFAFEPTPGLPAPLPSGEQLLWQGSPDWRSLAIRAYHVRKVAIYFGLLVLWRVGVGIGNADGARSLLISCLFLALLGAIAAGVLSLLAYLNARSTIYSITSRRVLLRHGVAVPITLNVPFGLVDNAALKSFRNGAGDLTLTLPRGQRVGYLITWPHVRPGHITRPEPSLRALPEAATVAGILGAALAAHAGAGAGAADVPATGGRVESLRQRPAVRRPPGPHSAAAA